MVQALNHASTRPPQECTNPHCTDGVCHGPRNPRPHPCRECAARAVIGRTAAHVLSALVCKLHDAHVISIATR
jgi:hypothetical protein